MLRDMLGDPSWLFELGFPILRISDDLLVDKPERLQWELGDAYRTPAFHLLNKEKNVCEVSMAWSDRGFFVHAIIPTQGFTLEFLNAKSSHPHATNLYLSLYLDTRWSPDVRRGTQYCHRFSCVCERPTTTESVRGHGELVALQRARAVPADVHPKDIAVGALLRSFGYEMKIFLPKSAMTGFDPTEFQEVGVFYNFSDVKIGSQCMARTHQSPYFEDPSVWCRGQLIQSVT